MRDGDGVDGVDGVDFRALVRARLEPLDVDAARAADIVDEMAQHCAQHYADLVASGVGEREALTRALAPLENRQRLAEEIARVDRPRRAAPPPPASSSRLFVDVWRDVRYAARLLRRSPGFTAVAVVTLALGIGANATIFSVVNAVLLRPLPFADPARLVDVGDLTPDGRAGNVGFATVADWRERTHAFEQIAMIRSWYPTLITSGQPERIPAMRVSANFFRTLGVAPALGRDFAAADDTPAGWRVLMLSDGLWRRRFNADPAVVGRVVTMNDQQFTVGGVMPPSFPPIISEHFYEPAQMWALLGYDRSQPFACRSCQHLKAIARLEPNTTIEAALLDVNGVHAALRREHPADYSATSIVGVTPLADELAGNVRAPLFALMGAVAIVLLIASANVASLLLARIADRERDLALRTALGASRGRIVRQLLVESSLVASLGGLAGLALAAAVVPLVADLSPVPIARLAAARVDVGVVVFALAVSFGTAMVFGLAPALRASRVDLQTTLRAEGRHSAANPASVARRLLIAADVALAVVLLAGAGLMIKSVGRLLGVDPGFDPDGVLTMQISMVGKAYAKNEAVVAKGDDMLAALRRLPGVESVALAGQIPLGGNIDRWGLHVEGRPATPDDPSVERYSVTPDYFSVMRIPLRRGRLITGADRANTEPVMVVGDRTARTVWRNSDPLGQHARIGGTEGPVYTVVGIVGDVRHVALAEPPTLQMYTAQAQLTDSFLTVVMRSKGDFDRLAPAARQAIWSAASDVPVYRVDAMRTLAARSVGARRFVAILLELFGAVALVMTAVGVYGVISYSVAERTREIGIRSALGASRADIVRLVLASGLALVSAGLATGIVLAIATTRFLDNSLYGVKATDPATLAIVASVLFTVAAAAHLVPIARAMRVDPAIALRQD
jgi:putative ABC transport system permease protein